MASTFTWLDYSERERRQMRDLLSSLDQQDTRDELGIANIRDGFADLLFPGTTTIMTRARYFLFVPWIYQKLEAARVPSLNVAGRLREQETRLATRLLAAGESDGVIGRIAGERLQRLPSNIYWLGLKTWGIRLYPGGQSDYHRSLDSFYTSLQRALATREEGSDEFDVRRNWHAGLPAPPPDFPTDVMMHLRREEAQYLRERIAFARSITGQESLLAVLVRQCEPADCDFVWMHPQASTFPPHAQRWLKHLRAFSESMHGAALLYNLMLAELDKREDLREEYTLRLTMWSDELDARQGQLAEWDRGDFWQLVHECGVRNHPWTRAFVDVWLDVALNEQRRRRVMEDSFARRLIMNREQQLKKGRARLVNRRALEMWSGYAGTGRMAYRWGIASRIFADVHEGLSANA